MLYKITRIMDIKDIILIEDVIKADETLIAGYDKKVGTKIKRKMSQREFLDRLFEEVRNLNVAKIEKIGSSSYRIERLQLQKAGAIMLEDELEFRNLPRLTEQIDRLLFFYSHAGRFIRSRVYRKYGERGAADSQFKKCWDVLYEFYKTKQLDNTLDKKEIAEIYKYLKEQGKEFKSAFLIKNKIEHVIYSSITVVIIAILAFATHKLFLSGYRIFPLMSLGGMLLSVWGIFEGYDKHHKEVVFRDCLNELERRADKKYLKDLDEPVYKRKIDFLTLIKHSLNRINSCREESFDEDEFYTLALNYSTARYEELGTIKRKVDTHVYVDILLNILIDKFTVYKKYGFTRRQPSIDVNYLYEVFDCLGYGKEVFDKDDLLRRICESILEVSEDPYEGCEIEILEFIRVAVKYASLDGEPIEAKEKLTKKSELEEKLEFIYLAYIHKHLEAQKIEEMIKDAELYIGQNGDEAIEKNNGYFLKPGKENRKV